MTRRLSDTTRLAIQRRVSRERIVRMLITGEIRGSCDLATGVWTIDPSEFEKLAAPSVTEAVGGALMGSSIAGSVR